MKKIVAGTFVALTLFISLVSVLRFMLPTSKSTHVYPLKSYQDRTAQSHSLTNFSYNNLLQARALPNVINLTNAPQRGAMRRANIVRNRTAKRHPPRHAPKHRANNLIEAARLKQYRGSPCHNLSFAHPPLPVTALASFPGSGNTWLRHLIQEATGLAAGAIYPEPEVLTDFPGGGITDGRVVVVKTHQITLDIRNLSRAIILIRNPFTALISWFNWLFQRSHIKGSRDTAWKKHIVTEIEIWFKDYDRWLQLPKPKLVVVYEHLKRDTRSEMRKIIRFLNITLMEDKLECMLKNSEGRFHRKPTDASLYPFPENVIKIIKSRVSYINKLLLQNNLHQAIEDKLPTE